MKRSKIIRLASSGPGPNARQTIAEAKGILRTREVRAVALVVVEPNGRVGTIFGGHREGHFHQLRSGVEELRERLNNVDFD